MNDRFKFRIPMFTDKGTFMEFQYVELGDEIECTLCGTNGEPQQCTGLKDKNNKLVYDGDIVRLKAKNGMTFDYAVKFKNYCFILEYINGKLKGTKARNFAKQYAQPQRMYEHGYMVIGNIYENADLLEGKEQ